MFDLTVIWCDNEDRGDENPGLISLEEKKGRVSKKGLRVMRTVMKSCKCISFTECTKLLQVLHVLRHKKDVL